MKHDNDNNGLRFLSVCSGIEAASVAWLELNWRAVAFSEIERFPSAVLAHHYPDVPNLGDFTKISTASLGRVDILCGGTPCQAFSVAGLRQGLEDARGNLTLKFVELAHELADGNGLRNAVWENVVGVLSDKGNAFGCFLAGLVGADDAIVPPGRWTNAGMVSGPRGRAAWRVLDAQYFGVAQRRRRVIVVADFGNGADPATVLLIEQGLPRNPPTRGEAGKDVAGGFEVGPSGGRFTDIAPTMDCRAKNGPVQNQIGVGVVHAPEIARCVATREGSSQDYETTTMVAVGVHGDIAHTLKAEGADASEDGTGRGTPIIAFSSKDYGGDASFDISPTLRSGNHSGSHANGGVMPAVAFAQNQLGEVRVSDVMGTLNTNANASGRSTPMAMVSSAVRRLTPTECERLQGFPDSYTDIPWRGKPNSPDGPRYKALGNSWAVPKFTWLGRRIAALMPMSAANDNEDIRNAA